MRNEFRKIERTLVENGWVLSVPAREGEMAEYVKNYNNGENVVGIEIALEPCSLSVYGMYGIGCIQLIKFESNMPYIRDDIMRMQGILKKAERELLRAGIPFRSTYLFADCTESMLGDNLNLREEYHMDQCEKEDWIAD